MFVRQYLVELNAWRQKLRLNVDIQTQRTPSNASG